MVDNAIAKVPSAGPPAGFVISTPANWTRLDFDTLGDEKEMARQVEAQTRAKRQPKQVSREIARILALAARSQEVAGLVFAAATYETDGKQVLTANVTIVMRGPSEGTPTTLETIAAQLGADPASKRSFGQVNLRGGRALRAETLSAEPSGTPGLDVAMLTVQYFVCTPDESHWAIITCGSPSVAFRDPLERLFDLIANSFEFR